MVARQQQREDSVATGKHDCGNTAEVHAYKKILRMNKHTDTKKRMCTYNVFALHMRMHIDI